MPRPEEAADIAVKLSAAADPKIRCRTLKL